MSAATNPAGRSFGTAAARLEGAENSVRSRLWLIEPNADPEDPWWQGRPIWQLVVAAPSAAFARLEAERWALRQRRLPAVSVGNESSSMNAGFVDSRLYHARPLPDGALPATELFARNPDPDDGPVTVLAGPMAPRARA